jgi:hypothetical protein
MTTPHSFPLALAAILAGSAAAQDVLYYKFDDAGGKRVVNYAAGSTIAPTEGTLSGGNMPQFQAGKFGAGALSGGTATTAAGSTFVDSGWMPNLNNSDFTIAFYIKQRTAPPSTSYFFYSNSGFRMFTGGVAAKGLYFRNGTSGTGGDWILTTDIQTLAAAGWVHVALVVDATALKATYYVNGVAQTPLTIAGGVTASGGTYTFRAAGFASYGGLYDIDEFRVAGRAASATEIQSWVNGTSGADGAYGKACGGAVLASSNGPPKLPTPLYALTISGNSGGVFALGLGSNRLMFGPLPLPLDLKPILPALAGCNWETSGDITFVPGVLTGGSAKLPLPLPPVAALAGIALWSQAVVLTGGPQQMTNAFSTSLGL